MFLELFFREDIWSVTVFLPANVEIQYRYFICVALENDKHIIKRREVFIRPRTISKTGMTYVFCAYARPSKIHGDLLVSHPFLVFSPLLRHCTYPLPLSYNLLHIKGHTVSFLSELSKKGLEKTGFPVEKIDYEIERGGRYCRERYCQDDKNQK